MGRNSLEHIQLDWKIIGKVNASLNLHSILSKHAEVFNDELGTIQPVTASLQVRPDASPRFCKARSVPFAIKSSIEDELERLESSGVLQKVDYSPWAEPIVAVPKKDDKIRICGDYKVTVNQALEVDQYSLPKPEDLFISLVRGEKFTKLDLPAVASGCSVS